MLHSPHLSRQLSNHWHATNDFSAIVAYYNILILWYCKSRKSSSSSCRWLTGFAFILIATCNAWKWGIWKLQLYTSIYMYAHIHIYKLSWSWVIPLMLSSAIFRLRSRGGWKDWPNANVLTWALYACEGVFVCWCMCGRMFCGTMKYAGVLCLHFACAFASIIAHRWFI